MSDERFPLDWDKWQQEWRQWLKQHDELTPTAKAIPGQNFLADEILGTFKTPDGRTVELSEVTFPNLEERNPQTGVLLHFTVRSVGLTWADTREGGVVKSFADLESALGL